MKLLILSDSHRTMEYLCRAVEREQPDHIIHLGDHESDAERLRARFPHIPLWSVCGNCDFGASPERIVDRLGDVLIYACHGHTLSVKSGLLRAKLAAREAGAQIFLFGHTHRSLCDWRDGIWFINPGSCSGRGPVTYAVIELDDGCIRPAIRTFDNE